MNQEEIWHEICFLLSDNINTKILEKDFESQIVRAIEKLGWREFTGEVKRQPELKIGRSINIRPDIAIYGVNNEALVMIEVKRPTENISKEEPADQLISYMLQTQAEFGLLIGSSIRLFYNGKENPQRRPILLDRIPFDNQSEEGLRFVSIFERDTFLKRKNKEYINLLIERFIAGRNIKKLKEIILGEDTRLKIISYLKSEFSEYGSDVIEGAFSDLKIDISFDIDESERKVVKPLPPPDIDIENKGIRKTIYDIIRSHKEGIAKDKISKLTGFSERQLSNAIYRLSKKNKIKTVKRGVYVSIASESANQELTEDHLPTKNEKTNFDGSIREAVYEEIAKYPNGCSKEDIRNTINIENKQLSNTLHRLKKSGMITSLERGKYCKINNLN